jgi:hypothetical protein
MKKMGDSSWGERGWYVGFNRHRGGYRFLGRSAEQKNRHTSLIII